MNTKQITKWISSDWFYVLVSLLTLETFVVAQSVYDILASNQEFLAVRQVTNQRLLEIVLVFNLLPVLVLFLLWALCRRLHIGLSRAFLSVVYFSLFFAFFLQAHNTHLSGWQLFPHSYLLWIVPSVLLVFVSLRYEKPFRTFVLALSPVVLIFPLLFLNRTWTTPKELLSEGSLIVQKEVSQAKRKNFPPIFMLVLDEFTLHALLDDTGQIDETRFPNFKRLASESYWFRNTTANAEETTRSIPVILTGNFASGDNPSFEDYPNNLFSLLQQYYDIYVHEVITHFCVPRIFRCPDAEIGSSRVELLKDVFYLYAFRVLPKNANISLPNFTMSWGPFRSVKEDLTARVERFQRFVDSLGPSSKENVFHYFHHLLPHGPFALSSDGRIYDRSWHIQMLVEPTSHALTLKAIDQLYAVAKSAGNTSLLETLRDSYLMQVSFVDKEIGRFVTRLKQVGLYDKSLIIITSDHGVSYKSEFPGRWLSQANADMILTVPLFIKLPFQEQGVVSDKDVQLIDIVPTIAGIVGLRVPWQHIGRNIFISNLERRQKIAYNKAGNRFEFPDTLGVDEIDVYVSLSESPLIGQKIEKFDAQWYSTVKGVLDPLPASLLPAHIDGIDFPIYVHGWAALLDRSSVPNQIAVAVNGKIVAVTSPSYVRPDVAKAYQDPGILRSGWITFFSIRELREGANTITVYAVLDAKKKKLALLSAKNNTIQVVHK